METRALTYEELAQDGSRTARREARRSVRAVLGTSSDAAPTALEALTAVRYMDDLMRDASGGMFRVKIVSRDGVALDFAEAKARLDVARGAVA